MSDHSTTTATQYNVIIDSIGASNPASSKILADVLGIPVEVILKGLYNTPTVLFSEVEEELATKSVSMLKQLGMEAHSSVSTEPLPQKPEKVDIGVYIKDLQKLAEIIDELSIFLGCPKDEALKLLMNDPCVILGGVSLATAEALRKRIDAEVIVRNPKEEKYTIRLIKEDPMLRNQLKNYLKFKEIEIDAKNVESIENLSYEMSQEIWRKFQSTGLLKIVNQGFQRFEIILTAVDKTNPDYKTKLTELAEIPEEVIDDVLENLPIQIEPSINRKDVAAQIEKYKAAGLTCTSKLVQHNNYKLVIEESQDLDKTREILKQFVAEEYLPKDNLRWEIPFPLGELLFRYIAAQLEIVNCEIDCENFTK